MVAASNYGEPLLIPKMREAFRDLKSRDLPVVVNTNGLTLTDDIARFWVGIKVDSVMFSIDATSNETLKKVRGVAKLEKIEKAVYRLMAAFCKNCNGWVEYAYEEEIRDGLLIRRSPQYTYYNKISRLVNWKGTLLGGHRPPPAGLAGSEAVAPARAPELVK